MALPTTLSDREYRKFEDAADGPAVRVLALEAFAPPASSDAGTVEYPDSVTEVYKFREGGVSGTVLKTLTLVYTTSTKEFLASWVIT